jgi:hypothetical protein
LFLLNVRKDGTLSWDYGFPAKRIINGDQMPASRKNVGQEAHPGGWACRVNAATISVLGMT